ncbi:MAG: diacylglycerol kinase family protein [Acutalibacteraceae bacterium]|jgi:diacylglycerol kinase
MKRALRGFWCALCGIGECLRREWHFRFHLATAFYVFCISPYFLRSPGEWAALVLTVGAVLAAEAINTAVERAVDLASPDKHPLAKAAKDAAAGAVLLCALTAIGVAVCLLTRAEGFAAMGLDFAAHPVKPVLLGLSLPPTAFLVFRKYNKP